MNFKDSFYGLFESLITESMNVNVSMSTNDMGEPTKSITVSAEGEQAEMLAQLLNLAGLQGQQEQVDEVDENQPDWPTDAETTGNNDPELKFVKSANGDLALGTFSLAYTPPPLMTYSE